MSIDGLSNKLPKRRRIAGTAAAFTVAAVLAPLRPDGIRAGPRALVLGMLTLILLPWPAGQATADPAKGKATTSAYATGTSPFNFFIQKVAVSVRLQAGSTSADITFTTREPAHGLVEISTKPSNDLADTTPSGQQPVRAFPPGAVTMSWNNALGAKATRHALHLFGLTPRTTYYYVITASGADGRTFRYWHRFSTATDLTTAEVTSAGKDSSRAVLEAFKAAAGEAPATPVLSQAALDAMAAKGEALAAADPLALELRRRAREGPMRRGLDIGLAAAEGHTLPGPGKDRIRDALLPAERVGFNSAVGFSLERNRNAQLAATGAAIARADPLVEQARTAETAILFRLGFDIATGIFGDPALGARGNTATGPGSLGIRDSLSDAGQRGFNAAVRFHLARKYKS